MKQKQILGSAISITGVNILLRLVGISFGAYVSAKIGAQSLGLFTLVMSVYGFAAALSVSGVGVSSVTLTAESCARLGNADACADAYRRATGKIMRSCTLYSLMFSVPSAVLLYAAAPFISSHLLGDIRTLSSLRILSCILPAISLSSAISGYFTGVRKAYKGAVTALFGEAARILFTSTALSVLSIRAAGNTEYACLAVVGGCAVSELFSLIINFLLYIFDNRLPGGEHAGRASSHNKDVSLKDVISVSAPIGIGVLVRRGFSSAEHISIPWGMKKSGLDADSSTAAYGVLHGMAFPLILFPSVIISSFAGLMVPELAELSALDDRRMIRQTVSRVERLALLFSIGCAAVFFVFADELGMMIYGSRECAARIRAMAPLIPVMYFDTAVDCMLKGLGKQITSMKINIVDSIASLALVLILTPRFGINGYIASVYFCECLNCFLSLITLIRTSGTRLSPRDVARPLAFAAICTLLINCRGMQYSFTASIVKIFLFCAVYIGCAVISRHLHAPEEHV